LLDGHIDKAPVAFICRPDQLRRASKFTQFIAFVPLSNVVRVSPSVFDPLDVVYQRDDKETVSFRSSSRNAIKHAMPSYMIADSISRRRVVKSKRLSVAFYSRPNRDSVLAFLKDTARGNRDFQMMDVNKAESQFISSLIEAPVNRSFNNLVVFNTSEHYYFNVSSWLQGLVDQELDAEIWKQVFLYVLRQVQSRNALKADTDTSAPEPGIRERGWQHLSACRFESLRGHDGQGT
jgi:hypothetical protein